MSPCFPRFPPGTIIQNKSWPKIVKILYEEYSNIYVAKLNDIPNCHQN